MTIPPAVRVRIHSFSPVKVFRSAKPWRTIRIWLGPNVFQGRDEARSIIPYGSRSAF